MKFLTKLFVALMAFGLIIYVTSTIDHFSGTDEYDFSGIEAPSAEDQQSTAYTTYYNQLTDFQKNIYNVILTSISNKEERVIISNVDISAFEENCSTVTTAIQYDHPEYFWFTGGYSYKSTRESFSEQGEITLDPIYYEYSSGFFNAERKYNELQSAVGKVAELAKKHSNDDYERIVFVHDYLIKNAKYDYDALEEYHRTSRSPSCEYVFSAYGCLINGKTVCSGYAKAFQLIMQKLGYNCSYVTGEAGEAHGWNCVYLDGEGYYIDLTWDDLDLKKERPLYNYAFITSAALSKTHTVDMPFQAPVCTATDYNYFLHQGYYADKYDFSTASLILLRQSNNDAAHIQFGSLEELEKAYTDIIKNGRFKQIPGIDKFSQHYYNEDHYTLTLLK